jgi:hypothetical protein
MKRWRSRAAIQVVVTLGGLLLGGAALGYILPGWSILRRTAETRDKTNLTGLRVDGTAFFYGAAAEQAGQALTGAAPIRPELQVNATLLFRMPGRCRLELSSPEGGRAVMISASGRKRTEGQDLPTAAAALEHVCAILGSRGSSESETLRALDRHVRTFQVEVKSTALGRFGGEVAYVLGGLEPTRSQFWIYKDAFQPARLRFADSQGYTWDVRFLDYNSPATGDWFPRVVELMRYDKGATEGELLFRFTGLRGDNRAMPSDKLF